MPFAIPEYPDTAGITIEARPMLHPMFRERRDGVSEFTFANIYLFRATHGYRLSQLRDGPVVITGSDEGQGGRSFFMLPFGLPSPESLRGLFEAFSFMKCVTEAQAAVLSGAGYRVEEDRDNFDYLYAREDLSTLSGRRFHRKKNLVNFFTGHYNYVGKPLLGEYIEDALRVLDEWRDGRAGADADYEAAKEALLNCERLQLCGGIYYVEGEPAAYTLGEELTPDTFVIHFEKGLERYKGLLQFVNLSFASLLTQRYSFINREQDLGDPGLRKSKMSYKPAGFIKKYRASLP
ncbi:MAG: DUF2156 domain-containing protein [Thermodesulfobacteriota bacterium]